MKVHICCLSEDEAEGMMSAKVEALSHELVEHGSDAHVVLVIATTNNYREAMNWIPVLWDVKPTTPIIFVENDYPNRIYGSLEARCSLDDLQRALKGMVVE